MTRKEFHRKCRHNGVCSSVNIEECDSDNESDYPSQYESDICMAEITED